MEERSEMTLYSLLESQIGWIERRQLGWRPSTDYTLHTTGQFTSSPVRLPGIVGIVVIEVRYVCVCVCVSVDVDVDVRVDVCVRVYERVYVYVYTYVQYMSMSMDNIMNTGKDTHGHVNSTCIVRDMAQSGVRGGD
jgi:hypothetical protein